MAIPPEVRSGDVITADFMNSLLAEVADLKEKVANLSTGPVTGLAILSTSPSGLSGDPIRVDEELRIVGQEFRFSAGGHRVSFDGIPVNAFKSGSSDSLLIVTVPTLSGSLPSGGRPVTLRVENGLTFVNRTITVRPAIQDVQGTVNLIFRDDLPNPVPDPITAGTIATFAYRITSLANLAAEWPISVVTNPDTFEALASITDTNGAALPAGRVLLEPGATRDFLVRIPLPAASDGDSFTMSVATAIGTVQGGESRSFIVGTATEPTDETIDLGSPVFSAIDPNTGGAVPAASFNLGTNTIRLPAGALGTIEFTATFEEVGLHLMTVQPAAGSTGWTLTRTPTQHTETEIHDGETLRFTLTPSATATTPTEITYRVKRQGETLDQTRRFTAERI